MPSMNQRSLLGNALKVGLLGLLLNCSPAAAQGDPVALQQQAIRRLDGFVDHFRKTGDMQSRLPELAQAEAELAASNRALAARGDWSALAIGLTKQGHVYRMQGHSPTPSRSTSRRRRQPGAGAMSCGKPTPSPGERWRSRRAGTSARRTPTPRRRSGWPRRPRTRRSWPALSIFLGTVQIAQRDLAGASDTVNREVEVARQAKDPMAAYFPT